MTIQLEFLQSIPYLAGLSTAEVEAIGSLFFEKTLERGEMALIEGDPSQALYFVHSGAVKLLKTSAEGKEQILDIARPGDSLNDVPLFDGEPNPVSAQAMGAVTLYGLSKGDVDSILRRYPLVALNVNRVLAGKVRHLGALVEDLSFRPVIGRVARILLEYAEGGENADARPRLTQQEMAAMAGTVREVVGRSLKALEDEGVISLQRHRLAITDKEGLKDMVEAYS